MNILHFSTFDFGGAGLTAHRIHKLCIELGYNSKMYVSESRQKKSPEIIVNKRNKIRSIQNKLINRSLSLLIDQTNLFISLETSSSTLDSNKLKEIIFNREDKIDIIFIHWVAGFINISTLYSVLKNSNIKVVYSLMDMAMLTGGCHYSFDCKLYMKQCFSCPKTNNTFLTKKIRDNFKTKCRTNIAIRPFVISASDFLLKQAKESAIPFYRYDLINPPLSDVFTYSNRDRLEEKKILMGAYNNNDDRKGYLTFLLAIYYLSEFRLLNDEKIIIYVPSDDFEVDFSKFKNVTLYKYKYATTDEELAQLYNEVDLLVNTSIDDSGPMMIIESLYCGTPVIGTKTGVTDEIFSNIKNIGFTIDVFDSELLAKRIYDILFGDTKISPSAEIEERVKTLFKSRFTYKEYFKGVINNAGEI